MVAFANNQVIVAPSADTSTIYTDPVALGSNDRGAAVLMVHYMYGGTSSTTLTYTAQVSNDGVEWVDSLLTDNVSAAGATPKQKVADLNGAFVRFKIEYAIDAGAPGGVCFDLPVNLDHK